MITGFLFLLAITHSIAIIASKLPMECKDPHFRYSEIKPTVAFARKYWSIPDVHQPFKGFEDKTPDKKLQLKAVRRQVLNTATFFMSRGETPTGIVQKLDRLIFGETRRDK